MTKIFLSFSALFINLLMVQAQNIDNLVFSKVSVDNVILNPEELNSREVADNLFGKGNWHAAHFLYELLIQKTPNNKILGERIKNCELKLSELSEERQFNRLMLDAKALFELGFYNKAHELLEASTEYESDSPKVYEAMEVCEDAIFKQYFAVRLKAAREIVKRDKEQQAVLSNVKTNQKSAAYPDKTIHCNASQITEVQDVVSPVTGMVWMDRNLGAQKIAEKHNDQGSFGDLYQWGRSADGHQCRSSQVSKAVSNSRTPGHGDFIISSDYSWFSSTIAVTSLWQRPAKVNDPCPVGYRLPTATEWNNERMSWNKNNRDGAMESPLKLPASGGRNFTDGSDLNVGSFGFYWSSSASLKQADIFMFSDGNARTQKQHSAFGASVRCIKDGSTGVTSISYLDTEKASNFGILYAGKEADMVHGKIYYKGGKSVAYPDFLSYSTGVNGLALTIAAGNFSKGDGMLEYLITGVPDNSGIATFAINIGGQSARLILVIYDAERQQSVAYRANTVHCSQSFKTEVVEVVSPVTGRVWMDRNLGAERVAQSMFDSQSFGDLYQWGRAADGHQCRDSKTSNIKSKTDVPGHADFIVTASTDPSHDWREPVIKELVETRKKNIAKNISSKFLWRGETGVNNPCPEGFRLPTGTEWREEIAGWSKSNQSGAFNSFLRLPTAGFRESGNAAILSTDSGNYWAHSIDDINKHEALQFTSFIAQVNPKGRSSGYSVRCIKGKHSSE